jgi:hypothetical protein
LDVLEATQPLADVPGVWELNIAGGMGMRQAVVELADGSVIVLDAPPHESKVIIEWANQTPGKPVTYVWVRSSFCNILISSHAMKSSRWDTDRN